MANTTTTLSMLQQLYPGCLLLDTHTLAGVLGIAYKTLNNAGDSFPVPSVKFGRRKYFRIIDVAAYIDVELGIYPAMVAGEVAEPIQTSPGASVPRQGRGRPRKSSNRVGGLK